MANQDLTAELALDLSVAAAHVLGEAGAFGHRQPTALVARDPRASGEFLEADRPRKVSLTFAMPQFSPESDLITVTFEPDGDGCLMHFRQEGIEHAAIEPSKSGWTPMFQGLAKAIGAGMVVVG